jgi:hypothetical protein
MHFTPLPYLDPGSASVFFQIMIAALLGAGVAIVSSWSKIKTFFGVKPKKNEEQEEDDDSDNVQS